MYHIVLIALATGARRGELLALKWDNINFVNNTITIKENLVEVKGGVQIHSPKTKASRRTIAVHPSVLAQLEELRSESDWVFHTGNGKQLSPSNVSHSYQRLLGEANLPNIRFHDLRHTHATLLIANGHNIKTVSARIGHTDIKITLNLYAHALPEQDREAADKIGAWLV
jgi:integrase